MNDELFGYMANMLGSNPGGNRDAAFPIDDATDMAKGLRFIPGEVTLARRKGERVVFYNSHCDNPCCWFWQFENGNRTYYWERQTYEQIDESCHACGNVHISGGHIEHKDL